MGEGFLQNILKGTDFPAGIQGKTPPSLIGIAEPILMGDMNEQLAVAGETPPEARARTTFNLKIRQARRDEANRRKAYDAQFCSSCRMR